MTDDGRQVMAKAHFAFGKVSSSIFSLMFDISKLACLFSSPCQRQSELLPSPGVRRPSSVVR
jgi:hypothetical protein